MRKLRTHRFSIAPMMDWTDRPCRTYLRLLAQQAVLYTEMLHSEAVLQGDRDHLLSYPQIQQPLVLQLGGSDPARLAQAALIGEDYGYDEINLNVGCPSDRVQSGNFGASLMLEPELTAELVAAMTKAVSIPVTVKCRIGVDDQDEERDFNAFIDLVAEAGCRHFIVHARKAWLKGLSPKENRDVPPLDYERVYRLKQRRSDLEVSINGGIEGVAQAKAHLEFVDGVMMGRAAYHNSYLLAQVDREIYGDRAPAPTRREIVETMVPYIEEELARGLRLHQITRHMIGLYHGEPGARVWRRGLSVEAGRIDAGAKTLLDIMEQVEQIRENARSASNNPVRVKG